MDDNRRIPLGLKTKAKYIFSKNHIEEYEIIKEKPKCVVCMAANYGNLGDVAITYAQEKFLRAKLPEYEIIDLAISDVVTHLKALKNVCTEDDIITIVGGGFMGDLYPSNEMLRQLIIATFRNSNKIISFPQTADFSDTKLGRYMLKRAQRIYSSASALELWAREEKSYLFMKHAFARNKVLLTPDIVMSLDERGNDTDKREGVIFCLRKDKEKNQNTDKVISGIKHYLNNESEIISFYDTHIGNVKLSLGQRIVELDKIWAAFRRAQLVVTDRLHGMIFAFITGTPALVLPGNNTKIKDSFAWLKDCGYIKFVSKRDDFNIDDLFSMRYTESGFDGVHKKICQIFDSIKLK